MRHPSIPLLFASSLAVLAGPAAASGFRIPEMSVAGLGQANAVVADDEAVGNFGYNNAGMAFHPGLRASAEAMAVSPSISVTNPAGSYDSVQSIDYVPALYATYRLQDRPLAIGLGINAPFGLSTEWPQGAFPEAGNGAPTLSEIRMVNVNPAVAYLVRPNLSLSLGLNYYNVLSAKLNTVGADVDGSGSGFGGTLALLYTTERMNVGLQYRSRVKTDLDGDFTLSGGTAQAASTQITFPDVVQAGVMYRISPQWSAEFDLDWTRWSSFDQLRIEGDGGTLASETSNWKDSLAYRLGTSYRLNDALIMRAGYSYDPSAQPDEYFSPRIPDAGRHMVALGAGLNSGAWDLNLGLNYVLGQERSIENPPPTSTDLNGTSVFNGTYKNSALLYGVSLSRRF
ncbi:OmpP1/FadL family transporter [Thermithiobacillus plumbiphilus]|uniref:Outer membrane protein transport protein n=1 Tax=Thermithiobacillus plumbiphilus TaxID=1729899 RepID=A0ABU9D5E8_9PROT